MQCHSGCYCSKKCQKEDWHNHKTLCTAISSLEAENSLKAFEKWNFSSNSSLTPKEKYKLVKLVGEKCTIDCELDEIKTEALLDTGAEVTVIGKKWLEEHFPHKEIKNVSELIGEELCITAANNSKMEYLGYVEILVKLSGSKESVLVPFLVVNELGMPIIGYNVIEEMVKLSKSDNEIVKVLSTGIKNVSKKKIDGLVNLVINKDKNQFDGKIFPPKNKCPTNFIKCPCQN